MYQNVVVGKPLVNPWHLISSNPEEFENFDKKYTLFTNERYLPAILVEAGIVKSRGEVRKNKPELCINLDKVDCLWVKWGKQRLYIVVGLPEEFDLSKYPCTDEGDDSLFESIKDYLK